MASELDEAIDLSKRTPKELMIKTYEEIQDLKKALTIHERSQNTKVEKLDKRLTDLELLAATNKGVRLGLSLAVTILSIAALAISVISAFVN